MDNLNEAILVSERLKKETEKEIEFLKLAKYQFRFNGVADLYIPSFKVFDVVKDEWYRDQKKEEGYEILKGLISVYEKRPMFKKTKTGRMTYQEFKHKMK